MNDKNAIGQRVRMFREAKGLSQMDLELMIGASAGHISRIESGRTNPTKETLDKIAQILQLTDKEQMLLFGQLEKRSDKEIETVLGYCRPYLEKSENPAYLSDDRWFIYMWNTKLLTLLGISDESARELAGIHELEIVCNPSLPLRRSLDRKEWNELAKAQIRHFIYDTSAPLRLGEEWLRELIGRLNNMPGFMSLWEEVIMQKRDILPEDERYVLLPINGLKQRFFISALNIDKYPRYAIIELLRSN